MDSRYFFLAGLLGPLLFALVILVLGLLVPGYTHFIDYISELGAVDSPVMAWMNFLGFLPLGMAISAFGIGWNLLAGHHWKGKAAALCFGLGGISMMLVSILPCDAGCVNTSPTGFYHELASLFPLVFGFIGLALVHSQLVPFPEHRVLRKTIILALLLMLPFNYLYLAANPPFPGLVQRIAIGIPLFILLVASWQFYRNPEPLR